MYSIDFAVTIDDLIAFNQYVFRKSIVLLLGGLFLFLQSLQLIGALSSGDFSSFWYTTGTSLVLGLFLISSEYRPQAVAILSTVLIVFVTCLFLLIIDVDFATKVTSIVALIPMLAFGYWGVASRRLYKYFYGGKNDSVGSRTLILDPSGLLEKTSHSEGRVRWALISSVEQVRHNIYLFLARNKALIIPKRAFPSSADADSFVSEAVRFKSR